MRIWSLHPIYLDSKGLVALWREGLLAQKVLQGKTKGYRNHPQLLRFKEHTDPSGAIAFYLKEVYREACRRKYQFDPDKIPATLEKMEKIVLTRGQLSFETEHLLRKLKKRDPQKLKAVRSLSKLKPHPLFKLVVGKIADWEKGT